eukprot:TRINITY_DN10481_c0_g1_i2.p1 TRINITY_DN10481_c0_g1~~TRINITY_DN10481_c0_g1_i2.p1  ORF type:complete len:660 (+),score=122.97 TRINITY_DN10481_c0_g1_i2:97-1980(+)
MQAGRGRWGARGRRGGLASGGGGAAPPAAAQHGAAAGRAAGAVPAAPGQRRGSAGRARSRGRRRLSSPWAGPRRRQPQSGSRPRSAATARAEASGAESEAAGGGEAKRKKVRSKRRRLRHGHKRPLELPREVFVVVAQWLSMAGAIRLSRVSHAARIAAYATSAPLRWLRSGRLMDGGLRYDIPRSSVHGLPPVATGFAVWHEGDVDDNVLAMAVGDGLGQSAEVLWFRIHCAKRKPGALVSLEDTFHAKPCFSGRVTVELIQRMPLQCAAQSAWTIYAPYRVRRDGYHVFLRNGPESPFHPNHELRLVRYDAHWQLSIPASDDVLGFALETDPDCPPAVVVLRHTDGNTRTELALFDPEGSGAGGGQLTERGSMELANASDEHGHYRQGGQAAVVLRGGKVFVNQANVMSGVRGLRRSRGGAEPEVSTVRLSEAMHRTLAATTVGRQSGRMLLLTQQPPPSSSTERRRAAHFASLGRTAEFLKQPTHFLGQWHPLLPTRTKVPPERAGVVPQHAIRGSNLWGQGGATAGDCLVHSSSGDLAAVSSITRRLRICEEEVDDRGHRQGPYNLRDVSEQAVALVDIVAHRHITCFRQSFAGLRQSPSFALCGDVIAFPFAGDNLLTLVAP